MSFPKVSTGARAILKINNRVVAFANSVSYRIGYSISSVNTLGRLTAARFEPTGSDVTLNLGMFRYTAPGGKGNAPDGTLGLVPTIQGMLTSDDIKIELKDRVTGETILMVDRARLTDRSGVVDARGILSETMSFVGVISWSSDSGVQSEGGGVLPPNNESAS
jgi:hypothetical protein